MTKMPAHRRLSAWDFAIAQVKKLSGLQVSLHHKPLPESDEDDEDTPLNIYWFTLPGEERRIHFRGFDYCWKVAKTGPSGVEWSQIKLEFTPFEVYAQSIKWAYVRFRLNGLDQVSGLTDQAPILSSYLFIDYPDEALFGVSSAVTAEYKLRLSVENATKRVTSAKRTLKKNLAISPFVSD